MTHELRARDPFEAFVRQWRPVLVASAREILGDSELVQDVVQTVFLKMWAGGGWEGIESPRTYCRRAAHREALRALAVRRRSEPLSTVEPYAPSSAPGPEEVVRRREDRARLHACLRRLPERCALVMSLSLVEGLGHGEIANRLGISRKAVEKQVARGKRHLHRWMKVGPQGGLIWLSSSEDGGG